MIEQFWSFALSIAGVGAIAAFVLWSLYRGWLQPRIVKQPTGKQTYKLLILFLVLTFSFCTIALVCYLQTKKEKAAQGNKAVISPVAISKKNDPLHLYEKLDSYHIPENLKVIIQNLYSTGNFPLHLARYGENNRKYFLPAITHDDPSGTVSIYSGTAFAAYDEDGKTYRRVEVSMTSTGRIKSESKEYIFVLDKGEWKPHSVTVLRQELNDDF